MNIENTAATELEYREDLYSYISDEYKSLHGYRPRHLNLLNMDTSDLSALADSIEKLITRKIIADAERDAKNVRMFEEEIRENITRGAEDRSAAIRWYLDARDMLDEYDSKYMCYCLNLPYSMSAVFAPFTITGKG